MPVGGGPMRMGRGLGRVCSGGQSMRNARAAGLAVSVLAAGAMAQPATEIRFSNGTNSYAAHPGESVRVSVYARGLPKFNSMIPWTTPPGTGWLRPYRGFNNALMRILG